MLKNSYVLRALKILGLEEILKISELLKRKELPHKKPAGLEDIDFPSTAHDPPENNKGEFFNVLSFPKNYHCI